MKAGFHTERKTALSFLFSRYPLRKSLGASEALEALLRSLKDTQWENQAPPSSLLPSVGLSRWHPCMGSVAPVPAPSVAGLVAGLRPPTGSHQ